MKLHWSPRSPFVRKVMVVLHETGLAGAVTLVRNPVAMNKPNPVVLADNPLGKIPTLVLDDGTVLVDSRVIAQFFDAKAKAGLFPAEGPSLYRALTWQAIGDGLLDLLVLWRAWASDRGLGPLVADDDAYLAAFALKAKTTLNALERQAKDLAAAPFGIGQIAIGCALSYLDFRWADLDWRNGRAALAAWHRDFEARPSVQATRIVDDAAPAQGSR